MNLSLSNNKIKSNVLFIIKKHFKQTIKPTKLNIVNYFVLENKTLKNIAFKIHI